MARNMVPLPIKMYEQMPGVMIDTRSFMGITKVNRAQIDLIAIQLHNTYHQLKIQTIVIKELIAATRRNVREEEAIEVDLFEQTIPCFINIIKLKLEISDEVQVAFEWHTNATVKSWSELN